MIWSKKQFIEALKKMKKNPKKYGEGREILCECESFYNKAIDDILQMIKDVGGCFK